MRKVIVPLAILPILVMAASTHRPVDASVTRGSNIGFRAADHNNYGVNNDKGMVGWSVEFTPRAPIEPSATDLGGAPDGQLAHQRMREAGIGWVRYWLSWQAVETSDGDYNWARVDHDINAAIDQGMNVYVTIQSAPAWAVADNKPTYHWGYCDGPGFGADFDSTKDYCKPASAGTTSYAPFDSGLNVGSNRWQRFVGLAVQRYGDRVKHWGFWNEPGNQWMWPEYPEAPSFNRMEQLVRKVIKPGRDAALAANPSVVIVGPEDNDPANLNSLLSLEQSGAYGRLFDVISIHAYNEANSPAGTRMDQFKAVLDNYHRREVWLGETNSNEHSIASVMEEFFVRGWVSKIFLYTMRDKVSCSVTQLVMLDSYKNPCYGHSLLAYHMASQGQPAVHFAGTTGVSGHNDFVLLQNPHAYTAGVNIQFATNTGAPPIILPYSLPPRSRTTVHVGSGGHSNVDQAVSVFPTTPYLPIFAEHADYWNGGNAGRLSQGSGERSDTWYFAEGAFAGGYFLHDNTVYNPSPTFSVSVTWKFLNTSGTTVSVSHTLAPRGIHKLNVNGVGGVEPEHGTAVSGRWATGPWVNLPAPIVAERTMSWGSLEGAWGGLEGNSGRGVPFASTQWYFAEGSQNGFWSTYLPIVNPTGTTATVHITYMTNSGPNGPHVYTINPNSRITVTPPALGEFGVIVKSVGALPVPVVVERSMYQGAGWTVGTVTEGATSPSQRWLLPEGSTEGNNYYAPFILIANPTSTTAEIELQFQLPGGGAPFVPAHIFVPAQSRTTVNPWNYAQLQNVPFSTEVIVINPLPVPPGVIVERAMYWGGLLGGHSGMGIY